VLLPIEFGDPKTWTQAEKNLNAEIQSLFEEAELRPFGDTLQRTGAIVHVMLKHPSVSFCGPDRDRSAISNADNQGHRTDEGYMDTRVHNTVTQVDKRTKFPPTGVPIFRDPSEADPSIQGTLHQEDEDGSGAASGAGQVSRRAENRYIYELRRRLKSNNIALAQGRDPSRFTGKESKSEALGPRRDRQISLLSSIDLQVQLSEVEATLEVNNPRVAAELRAFWTSSANSTWPADHSDRYEEKLKEKARDVQKMLDSHDPTSHNISVSRHNSLGANMPSEHESRQPSVPNPQSGEVAGSTIVPSACDHCPRQKKRCTHGGRLHGSDVTAPPPPSALPVPLSVSRDEDQPPAAAVSVKDDDRYGMSSSVDQFAGASRVTAHSTSVFAETKHRPIDHGGTTNATAPEFPPPSEFAQRPQRYKLLAGQPTGPTQSRKRSADLSSMSGAEGSKKARLNERVGQDTGRMGMDESAYQRWAEDHAQIPVAFGVARTPGARGNDSFEPAEMGLSCYTCGQIGHTTEQHDRTAKNATRRSLTYPFNEAHVKSQVVIRLTLEGHEGTQLVVFFEKHDRDHFLEKVKKRFCSKHVLSVTVSPNPTYDLPKKRKIGVDEAGNQAWDMVRSELIGLSRCLKGAYGSVEVNALVKYGG
jgi:hypothetical protein